MFGRPRQLFGAVIALNSRFQQTASSPRNRELVRSYSLASPGLWIPITMFALENKSSRTVY
jgi:hypothetical protein